MSPLCVFPSFHSFSLRNDNPLRNRGFDSKLEGLDTTKCTSRGKVLLLTRIYRNLGTSYIRRGTPWRLGLGFPLLSTGITSLLGLIPGESEIWILPVIGTQVNVHLSRRGLFLSLYPDASLSGVGTHDWPFCSGQPLGPILSRLGGTGGTPSDFPHTSLLTSLFPSPKGISKNGNWDVGVKVL